MKPELRIKNRTCNFRKAISTPNFESERVLARDAFEFGQLWLRRQCPNALAYWNQAKSFADASRTLPAQSSPLTTYYCFLNATKALLTVKEKTFSERHGVGGGFESSKRALSNEDIHFSSSGILGALSTLLNESDPESDYSLKDILSNLPFIHRAFRLTYSSHPELFIPIRNLIYRHDQKTKRVWVTAEVVGRMGTGNLVQTLPDKFEKDESEDSKFIIRRKKKVIWHPFGADPNEKEKVKKRLHKYHQENRMSFVYISASPDLWYLKRSHSQATSIPRYSLTLMLAAMHRLSELSRYDPDGLNRYLDGKENWLLTEFIETSPIQFLNEIVCEMTNFEISTPRIRPYS